MKSLSRVGLILCLVLSCCAAFAAPIPRPLQVVSDPAPIQMLVPGFEVRGFPIRLRNINNLVFAPDGRLFALGYDGNVHQLHDRDGDGMPEASTLFHDNKRNEIPESIGMAWGPARKGGPHESGGGLYIASRGKVLFLLDKGDGTSELQYVTGGWDPPTIKGGSSLDAVGVAVASDGDIYFALSVDAWRAPYRVNAETGRSEYNQFSERGTILRLSPDWKQRKIVCTGMRFPVSLDINAEGDLFASEQEGATWLGNGNPFDELLHIRKGRHYGFPPRHPSHLPGVIDEPSVFDYAPQHQSTCGLHFNEPVAGGGRVFGPDWWRGDALVSGESRGKIFRTKLVKTDAGYVAQNTLIACLSHLTIDAVPTPKGDLFVACHTGAPDWGTGPKGEGRLYRIRYKNTAAPQPTLAYAAGPTETRIVFDRPLDLSQVRNLAKRSDVSMGAYVSAGDRFETMRPGYQVVKDQMKVGRYQLPVLSAAITQDRREMIIVTESRTEDYNYAVAVAKGEGWSGFGVDALSDLNGVEAERGGEKIWFPHLDFKVARELTKASARHAAFLENEDGGEIVIRTQLDLHRMLRPAIQPGSTLDFTYAPERVTVVFESDSALEVRSKAGVEKSGPSRSSITVTPSAGAWIPVEVKVKPGARLSVAWFTAEDARLRAIPLRRFKLPWAHPRSDAPLAPRAQRIPEIAGGDAAKGRDLFFSERLACAKCHKIGDEGGAIGPDLSNLVHRDYESVMKDIVRPSAAINPDHISQNFLLRDGEEISGVVVKETTSELGVALASGETLAVPRSKIVRYDASSLSLMPEGLLDAATKEEKRDLMTFLLLGK